MAASTKLSFRARNLDSNKVMCIYFAQELPDLSECTPIARAVAQMPTGMEKDEEMESHLQDAILAQQASTSGVRMDNHVIPTPKVLNIDDTRYDDIYPSWPSSSKSNLIKVQAWLSLDKEEADYDVDSEDECWLASHPHIDARTLERIFDTLETQSSDSHICLPKDARSALTSFDVCVVDDVYDYWLFKRQATLSTAALGVGGFIPRVRTECRKDSQGIINPYVAFRRRAEKMQTRKNRKNDEDSYEKVLKLGHDLRKTVTLFDMVKRREKTKLALIDMESEILAQRMFLDDFGTPLCDQLLNRIRSESKPNVNGLDREGEVPKKKMKRRRMRQPNLDREVPSKAWLKKNAEVWNRPPTACTFNAMLSPIVEVDRSTQAACDANLDGRYTFKRRRGCSYRASKTEVDPAPHCTKGSVNNRLYNASVMTTTGALRTIPACRRRLGRGGRIILDRLLDSATPRVPKIYDPFDDFFVVDDAITFRARYRSEEDDELCDVVDSDRRAIDSRLERQWLESARSPSPRDSPNHQPHSQGFLTITGNGLAGRMEHTQLTKDCTTRLLRDEWRAGSGSPSESNSSTDWAPAALGSRQVEYAALSSEDEARTGDHPEARQPPSKESAFVGTVLECTSTPFLMTTPSMGTN